LYDGYIERSNLTSISHREGFANELLWHHISMIYDANIMLNLSRDINSLSNFKRNTASFIERLKGTKSPLVLTINGVSELVVQSAEGYQQLLDRIEYLETTAGIRQGLDELASGEAVVAIPALEALRSKLQQPKV
jgi:PHD/YefM family antitoxin component YafN of YafNO toxin-antitoxin module